MAIDTRQKRNSAICVSIPSRGLWPLPDAAISQADRQQTDFMYSGILASNPTPPVTSAMLWNRMRPGPVGR